MAGTLSLGVSTKSWGSWGAPSVCGLSSNSVGMNGLGAGRWSDAAGESLLWAEFHMPSWAFVNAAVL